MPIVGFLNCGPTCKANSNARPQTDLRFARILSVWVGQWGRVRAISQMRWPCTQHAAASRPHTFLFANTNLFFITDFWYMEIHHQNLTRTSIHVQEYDTRHQHDFHLTPYFLESVLEQSLQPHRFSNSAIARPARWGFADSRFPQLWSHL